MSSAWASAAQANTHINTNATGANRTDVMTASLNTCEGYQTAPTRSLPTKQLRLFYMRRQHSCANLISLSIADERARPRV